MYLAVQRVEAVMQAKQGTSGCSGAGWIARRSRVLRRSCGVDEALDALGTHEAYKDVTKVRQDMVNKKKRTGRRKAPWLRRK